MTQQTEKERIVAHVKDTLELIEDIKESNNIPDSIFLNAIFEHLYRETLKTSSGKFLGYVLKFDDLLRILSNGSADFLIENLNKGKLSV